MVPNITEVPNITVEPPIVPVPDVVEEPASVPEPDVVEEPPSVPVPDVVEEPPSVPGPDVVEERPSRRHHSLVHHVYNKYIPKVRSYTLLLVSQALWYYSIVTHRK